MRITSGLKTIFAAGIALLIISCDRKSKDKVKVTEITLQDITQEKVEDPPPPPPPPPKVEMPPVTLSHCFSNEGLKYTTTIKLGFNGKQVVGYVESSEIGSDEIKSAFFEGTKNGNELKVEFNPKNQAPIIGDASEWTDKPWTIKKTGSKETLHIIFNAKNYETNKWENTDYQFEKVECK